jgi:hypothetical protein
MPKMNRSEFAAYMANEFPEDKRSQRQREIDIKRARAESRRLRDSLFPTMQMAFIDTINKR